MFWACWPFHPSNTCLIAPITGALHTLLPLHGTLFSPLHWLNFYPFCRSQFRSLTSLKDFLYPQIGQILPFPPDTMWRWSAELRSVAAGTVGRTRLSQTSKLSEGHLVRSLYSLNHGLLEGGGEPFPSLNSRAYPNSKRSWFICILTVTLPIAITIISARCFSFGYPKSLPFELVHLWSWHFITVTLFPLTLNI